GCVAVETSSKRASYLRRVGGVEILRAEQINHFRKSVVDVPRGWALNKANAAATTGIRFPDIVENEFDAGRIVDAEVRLASLSDVTHWPDLSQIKLTGCAEHRLIRAARLIEDCMPRLLRILRCRA